MNVQEIAKTAFHILMVDTLKNRIYVTVKQEDSLRNPGIWQDWEKVRPLVSPGFTILADASQIQNISQNWPEWSIPLQQWLIEAGLAGIAEILSEKVADHLHIDHTSRNVGQSHYVKEEMFKDRRIAEAWLDRISRK